MSRVIVSLADATVVGLLRELGIGWELGIAWAMVTVGWCARERSRRKTLLALRQEERKTLLALEREQEVSQPAARTSPASATTR
jgi:hypothetical protein